MLSGRAHRCPKESQVQILFPDESLGRRLEAVDFVNERKTKLSVSQEEVIGTEMSE